MKHRIAITFILFAALAIVASLIDLFWTTSSQHSTTHMMHALMRDGRHPDLELILYSIRIPRLLLTLSIGAGLSISGAIVQGMLNNPLAEPYTMGISGGSAAGVSIATLLSLSTAATTLWGFGFAIATILVLLAIHRNTSTPTFLLSGVILSFFFASAILLMFAFVSPLKIKTIMLWLMGDIGITPWQDLIITGGLITSLTMFLLLFSRPLDLLSLGDERAQMLGLHVKNTQAALIAAVGLITALSVAQCGVIGFIGLIIPHIVRLLGPQRYAYILPASALCGSGFLVLCGTLSRHIADPLHVPIGVITGTLGALFFLGLLLCSRQRFIA